MHNTFFIPLASSTPLNSWPSTPQRNAPPTWLSTLPLVINIQHSLCNFLPKQEKRDLLKKKKRRRRLEAERVLVSASLLSRSGSICERKMQCFCLWCQTYHHRLVLGLLSRGRQGGGGVGGVTCSKGPRNQPWYMEPPFYQMSHWTPHS